MRENIKTEYCNYKCSMMLKELGYDEGCDSFYEDAIQHNGKDLSYDEELDLKGEGRGKEIKRVKGGWISDHFNHNTDSWLGKSCCSRPTVSQAKRWLREVRKWHIEAHPSRENEWHVWIVCLDDVNPEDGKLNACNYDGKTFKSYEKAITTAMEFLLKCMTDAQKKMLKGQVI
ncbi:MAG: hypothetical protein IKP36_05430 [Bacteroidaceae bacterium]|nr:hypothetical protein [Bacteroidaceae bacterium]